MEYGRFIFGETNFPIAMLWIIAALWIFNLIGQSISVYRNLKAPKTVIGTKIDANAELISVNRRLLEEHDKEIRDLKAALSIQCRALKALLNHELHNGNTGEMEKVAVDLDNWLINR